MKFKVGDSVRVGEKSKESIAMGPHFGKTGKIKSFFGGSSGVYTYYHLDFPHDFFFCEDELELESLPETSTEIVKSSNTKTLTKKENEMNTPTFVMPPHVLVKHTKNKNGRKIGTVVAAKINNEVRLGWSKCNTNVDSFDYVTGIQFALMSATYDPSNILADVPQSLQADYTEMKDRARRYFLKIGNFKKNTVADAIWPNDDNEKTKTSFSVGDKVRVVANPQESPVVARRMGQIGTIKEKSAGDYDWNVKFSDYAAAFYADELEKCFCGCAACK